MNATVHQFSSVPTTKSSLATREQREQRYRFLERQVKRLGEVIKQDREMVLRDRDSVLSGRAARAAVVVDLLNERKVLTVSDVKKATGVTMKTANRLLHHVAHAGDGVLLLEPKGATQRLVLFHPDLVVIEDPRKSAP